MVYDWELTGFSLIAKDGITLDTAMWLLTIIAHIGILILPFILNKSFYLPLLFLLPLIFVISLVVVNFFLFFALIPFLVLWIIAVRFAIRQVIE